MESHHDYDIALRQAAFQWLSQLRDTHGPEVAWTTLFQDFVFQGNRVPLVSRKGIFKPASLQVPLSITTSYKEIYRDNYQPDGFLQYDYRGTDPLHGDNVGLRTAMQRQTPLAWFIGMKKNRYLALWPVFVVEDHPDQLYFSVAVDQNLPWTRHADDEETALLRRYTTRESRTRIHQHKFRTNVLQAYRNQCSICRFRHDELLEAAHIIPDREDQGIPVVPNGISLCTNHHRAFDRYLIGIRPDFTVQVRPDLMDESDGPTLQHAFQGVQGSRIQLPRKPELQPSPERLQERYNRFLQFT